MGELGGVMKNNKSGFTLIELLVVVLIIGILSSIALPQYQKAVDKARAAEVMQLISVLQKGLELWILAHPGEGGDFLYSNSTDMLEGVDVPCEYKSGDTVCYINKNSFIVDLNPNGSGGVYSYMDGMDWVSLWAERDSSGNWTHKCGYREGKSREAAVCKGLSGYEPIENGEY